MEGLGGESPRRAGNGSVWHLRGTEMKLFQTCPQGLYHSSCQICYVAPLVSVNDREMAFKMTHFCTENRLSYDLQSYTCIIGLFSYKCQTFYFIILVNFIFLCCILIIGSFLCFKILSTVSGLYLIRIGINSEQGKIKNRAQQYTH